jgi:copper chaperone CopZ
VNAPAPGAVPQIPADQPTQVPGKDMTAPKHTCGCAGGGAGECGASCGGQCGGGADVTWGALPDNTTWQALHVTGMHCGGCAKRIERALAKVDGIKGVKIDFHSGKVEIAVADGRDARALVKSTIDGLGYHVD